MPVVPISPKGQILIPKKIREKYGVKPGSNVQILEETDGIVIKPAPEDPIAAACGFLEGDFSLTEDLIEEHRKESEDERPHRAR
ncbi:MAG: AbrB/MazE/SpoVT family DNA-binding domain-containing protein [Proteobacteria bacterium]|nr:AbrB/MazE/SpoVT family DNA-binding domain-containing protein [candidate division Zixibacteria bacterium]NIQ40017.1 AbrB/MazE/SpoVT family DNA-binding domain-containing protein [Pseudomonadota bacterium]